ncbi:cytochrome b5 domain-containing protein [Luteococcus peritonei]|uniref:Cytochrome b5 domain-containing protein n=1 Tax=Luteococcus peritonei TaxID=88874 RepID=A0ABW4RZM1_9ACTN
MKRWILVAVVVLVLGAIAWAYLNPSHAGDRSKLERTFTAQEQQLITDVRITPVQLSKATCEDGAHCWIAVDGVVYDMGAFRKWARGDHHDVKAGQDVTEQFVDSGHAVQVLQKLPVVGGYRA